MLSNHDEPDSHRSADESFPPVEQAASEHSLGQHLRPLKDHADKALTHLPGFQSAESRREIDRIVRRLEAIVINHAEGARRVRHPLTLEQVVAVIAALRAEAQGESRPIAFSDGEVTFYLMDGLYEELLGEPSNIFSTKEVAEGVTRFEPLQRDFWLACLDGLQCRMERLGLTTE